MAANLEATVAGWLRRGAPHLPVAMLIGAYTLHFARLSVAVHDGYGTPGYDMGIFDQGVWLLSRFHAPFVTVMGRNLFGDHTSFILLLAVPLYWIWPRPQTLLVLQTLLIAGAAIPIYLMGRRTTGSITLATGFAAAYLLNPALQNGNLEQFHPESFLVLSVSVAIYAAFESKGRLLAIAVVASLLVKEDTALLMVPLGIWVLWRRNRKWGAWIIAGSIAYAVVATQGRGSRCCSGRPPSTPEESPSAGRAGLSPPRSPTRSASGATCEADTSRSTPGRWASRSAGCSSSRRKSPR